MIADFFLVHCAAWENSLSARAPRELPNLLRTPGQAPGHPSLRSRACLPGLLVLVGK
jgi:hypothetical protein